MNAVPFDTLKMAQRLQVAGFSAPQASGAAEALAEALTGANLATKGDVAALGNKIEADNAVARSETKADNARLRTELMAAVELLRRDMTIKLGGIVIVATGVLLAAMRYMTLHP
ncbi:MAG TPA: hypothetical protein VFN42_07640 [Acetobacteraceae bacterium]|nr:hypothetical protein [Acetobacteraceae bacterium]